MRACGISILFLHLRVLSLCTSINTLQCHLSAESRSHLIQKALQKVRLFCRCKRVFVAYAGGYQTGREEIVHWHHSFPVPHHCASLYSRVNFSMFKVDVRSSLAIRVSLSYELTRLSIVIEITIPAI